MSDRAQSVDAWRAVPAARNRSAGPRKVRLWLVTAALARTADEMCPTALFLAVLAGSGRVSRASLTVACLTAAAGLAGPWMGSRLDLSASPRRVTASAMAVIATALLAAAVVTAGADSGALPPGVGLVTVLVLALCAGAAAPVVSGGWTAQLGGLVEPSALPRLAALDAATYNVAGIAGPGFVGLIGAAWSAQAALVTAALLMLVALLVALRVPAPAPTTPPGHHVVGGRSWWQAWSGARALFGPARLRRATVTTTVGYLGMGVAFVAAPVRGRELWDASAGGMLLAALAVGALVGTATMSWGRLQATSGGAVTAGTAGLGLCLLTAAAMPQVGAAAAVLALAGWCEGLLFTGLLRVRHRESPAGLRSSVFTTAASLKIAAYAVGVAAAGALSPGGAFLFVLAGSIQFVALGVGALTRVRPSSSGGP